MDKTFQQLPRLITPPLRLDQLISEAILDFAKENLGWEHHIGYHDEPLWILRKEEQGRVKRIQLAFFEQPDGLALYVIPDRSDLSGENRRLFRLKGQHSIQYKDLLAYDTKDVRREINSAADFLEK